MDVRKILIHNYVTKKFIQFNVLAPTYFFRNENGNFNHILQ